jgi:hypothetical protein
MKTGAVLTILCIIMMIPAAGFGEEELTQLEREAIVNQSHQSAGDAFSFAKSYGVQSRKDDDKGGLEPKVQNIIGQVISGGGITGYTEDIYKRLFPIAENFSPSSNIPTVQ